MTKDFSAMSQHPALKELSLCNFQGLSEDLIISLGELLARLKTLDLSRCKISNNSLEFISRSQSLHKLCLYQSKGFNDKGIVHLLSMRSLSFLKLGQNGHALISVCAVDVLESLMKKVDTLLIWGKH